MLFVLIFNRLNPLWPVSINKYPWMHAKYLHKQSCCLWSHKRLIEKLITYWRCVHMIDKRALKSIYFILICQRITYEIPNMLYGITIATVKRSRLIYNACNSFWTFDGNICDKFNIWIITTNQSFCYIQATLAQTREDNSDAPTMPVIGFPIDQSNLIKFGLL